MGSNKFINLVGEKHGKLSVVEYLGTNKYQQRMWKCVCDCGNEVIVTSHKITTYQKKSCGCLSKKHGLSNTRLSRIFKNMKQRCYNPNNPRYNFYGGLGIKVCDEWMDKKNGFIDFYNWAMNNGYQDDLTIDRIDVNGNYEPSNCRWITNQAQQFNKHVNHYITYNNKTQTLTEWALELGINRKALSTRLSRGWSVERAFTTPIQLRYNHHKEVKLCK